MRKLTPPRRRAAIFGGAAACIAASSSVLVNNTHTHLNDGLRGFAVGLSLALSMGALVMLRRGRSSCA